MGSKLSLGLMPLPRARVNTHGHLERREASQQLRKTQAKGYRDPTMNCPGGGFLAAGLRCHGRVLHQPGLFPILL